GRLYVTQSRLAFVSLFNEATLFGQETVLLFDFLNVAAIKKRTNAIFFDNSIEFELENGERHFFATFINRDKAYDFIVALWEIYKKIAKHGLSSKAPTAICEEAAKTEKRRERKLNMQE
ncbi:GRAM domain-containing protein, putative, partial [Eimeria tenella]